MKITNKTMVMLLLATLSITLFGTLASLNRISGIQTLTGAWEQGTTTRGSVNLTISSSVNINFTQDRVNWGAGYVANGAAACYLETSTANSGCTNFNDNIRTLLLENQGNSNVKLNLSNLNYTTTFIGGTNPGYAWSWNDPENDVTNNTCTQGVPSNLQVSREDEFRNISASDEVLGNGTTTSMLCSMFNASDLNDVINISFKLLIPSNAPAETGKYDTWTATAVAV